MAQERIQKILARSGYGSRRKCEHIISAGRITVNGQLAKLGDKADINKDKIKLDGQLISAPEEFVYIALHKPRGVLSATGKDKKHKTVTELVPSQKRLFIVGRLDIESEGLLFLTNDGELANRLMHPRYGHDKEYKVLIARPADKEQLTIWRSGVVLEDGYRTAPAKVYIDKQLGKGVWLRVIMKEGRKRQIREIANRLGLPVVKLIRVRIGSLKLGSLKKGEWRHLSKEEILRLKGKTVSKKKRSRNR
jgi:23S rRNA pseudouridine2605 synthase